MAYESGAIHELKITVRGRQVSQTVVRNGYDAPAQLEVEFKA